MPASNSWTRKLMPDGSVRELPAFHQEVCGPEEKMLCFACGGGGYGDPARRDPGRVMAAVNRGWLSADIARRIYGVSLRYDDAAAEYVLAG
jgi:N-methylhydantoinase B